MHSYEVEVKSLLGARERAERLKERIFEIDESAEKISENKQLNHYFEGGNLKDLTQALENLQVDFLDELNDIAEQASDFSVRTRDKDGEVFFVTKASIDETTSSNGISRIELEKSVSLSIDGLDKIILNSGFSCQAKWSREREEYKCKDINICLDRNAGYGYLAEFEKMINEETEIPRARKEISELMDELGVAELPQDRLARMFDHYNKNWPDYYGADKIFVIE